MQRLNTTLSHLGPSKDSEFLFTVPASTLSHEQRIFYEEKGFLVIKNCVPVSDIQKYEEHFKKLSEGVEKPSPTILLMRDVATAKKKEKGERAIAKMQHFEDDPIFFEYCKHPAILKYVAGIIGPNSKSVHTMLINKPPDVGRGTSRHPLHQDLWYFPFRPANRIVAAWTAMQKINDENGCLVVVPGSHKSELLLHGYPNWEGGVNKAYHGILGLLDGQPVPNLIPLHMEAGDTVFFHPNLIHGSGMNLSSGFRKAISCHYAASECFWIDVKGTIQEPIAKEVEEMAAIRMGIKIHFVDHWKYAARLVSGKDGQLNSLDQLPFDVVDKEKHESRAAS